MNDEYSGQTAIYAGMRNPPQWARDLQPGTFANISKNTLRDMRPSTWHQNIGDHNGPFNNWSNGVYASDYGSHGAYVVIGSGHLSLGDLIVAGAWVFDLDTCLWSMKSGPAAPIKENVTPFNVYGESQDPLNFGHPTVPHTYNGLIYQSESNGGAVGGSVIRNFHAASDFGFGLRVKNQCVHRYDLVNENDVPARVIDHVNTGSSYPASCLDLKRGGYWVMSGGLGGSLTFVSFDGYRQVDNWGVDVATAGNYCLMHVPTHDIIVAIGDSVVNSSAPIIMTIYVSKINERGIPSQFQRVTIGGDWDLTKRSGRMGGQWSSILGCIVSYNANGDNFIWRINIPDNYLTDTWMINKEFLTGVGGATWDTITTNGTWGRFVEVPHLRCFVYCGSVSGPVQAFKLAGM